MTEKFRFREKGIYRLVNAVILTGAVLFGGAGFVGIGQMNAWLAAEAAVLLVLSAGLNFLPVRGKLFCLSAAALGLCAAVAALGGAESMLLLRTYIPWLMGRDAYREWAAWYAALHTGIIVIGCYFLQILLEKVFCLRLVSAALFVAGACVCLFTGIELTHLGMAFGLCYAVTVCAEWVQEHWKKVRGGSTRAYMLRIMPFLAGYFLLMACMPVPENPYEWLWAKNLYRELKEVFLVYTQKIRWGGREAFGMSFSGFSEEGNLGGGFFEEDSEVMTVRIQNGSLSNLYLTGKVYDTFDGRQWEQNYEGGPLDVFWDTAETLCAARAFGGQYRGDYLKEAELRIRYLDFHTRFVFAPLKVREVEAGGEGFAYESKGGALCLDGYGGYGTEYRLHYERMNVGQAEFDRFLEVFSQGISLPGGAVHTDEAMAEELGKQFPETAPAPEEAARYRQSIYGHYLGENVLSEETAAYLAQVTAEAETNIEKLRAIERKLSGYEYTSTPGRLPGNIENAGDFLEYFLLENPRGYCTYFATAFVLLARAEGIPARYVQGYCVPMEGAGETNVYSYMAHAWPEAYIAGVGWIPFEPTPGYSGIRYQPWKLSRPTEETPKEEGHPTGDTPPGREEPEDREMQEQEFEDEDRARGERFWQLFVCALPVILIGYGGALVLANGLGRYRYRRMSGEERFRLEVFRNLKLLSLLGLEKGEQETLQELQRRCVQKLPVRSGRQGEQRHKRCVRGGAHDENVPEKGVLVPGEIEGSVKGTRPEGNPEDMLWFLKNYEDVIYGGRPGSEEMIQGAVEERQVLAELLRQERPWAYLYWRMRWSLIRYR